MKKILQAVLIGLLLVSSAFADTVVAPLSADLVLTSGRQLTVVTEASSTAIVQRYNGSTLVESTPMAASTTTVFGEYWPTMRIRVNVLTGSASYTEAARNGLVVALIACVNKFVTALDASGVATCTTDVLASAQHANQGTVTTVLHGNAAGNPSFGQVAIGADVSGLGTGVAASLAIAPGSAGGIAPVSAASTNNATCWKAGGILGYCSTIVGADGTCTCN